MLRAGDEVTHKRAPGKGVGKVQGVPINKYHKVKFPGLPPHYYHRADLVKKENS